MLRLVRFAHPGRHVRFAWLAWLKGLASLGRLAWLEGLASLGSDHIHARSISLDIES
jgi:hypothetical protein